MEKAGEQMAAWKPLDTALLALAMALTLTACGGSSASDSQSAAASQEAASSAEEAGAQQEGTAAINAGVEVKDSLEAYSWDELAQISNEIAAAGEGTAGVEVATYYGLCDANGNIDSTQKKSVEFRAFGSLCGLGCLS